MIRDFFSLDELDHTTPNDVEQTVLSLDCISPYVEGTAVIELSASGIANVRVAELNNVEEEEEPSILLDSTPEPTTPEHLNTRPRRESRRSVRLDSESSPPSSKRQRRAAASPKSPPHDATIATFPVACMSVDSTQDSAASPAFDVATFVDVESLLVRLNDVALLCGSGFHIDVAALFQISSVREFERVKNYEIHCTRLNFSTSQAHSGLDADHSKWVAPKQRPDGSGYEWGRQIYILRMIIDTSGERDDSDTAVLNNLRALRTHCRRICDAAGDLNVPIRLQLTRTLQGKRLQNIGEFTSIYGAMHTPF